MFTGGKLKREINLERSVANYTGDGFYMLYYFIGEPPIAFKERADSFGSLCFRQDVLFYFVFVGVMGWW